MMLRQGRSSPTSSTSSSPGPFSQFDKPASSMIWTKAGPDALRDLPINTSSNIYAKNVIADNGSNVQLGHRYYINYNSTSESLMRDLRHVNPDDEKKRIEDQKGGLLEASYEWIVEHTEFKTWRQWDSNSSSLLWIKGDPGKGKTMLACGIIDILTRNGKPTPTDSSVKSLPPTPNILHYFFQQTDKDLSAAQIALRSLLFMLFSQQVDLMKHAQGRYEREGKGLFHDKNSFFPLCNIFEQALCDTELRPTYVIVDAADECVFYQQQFLNLILKLSSTPLPVKWLITSRNVPEVEKSLGDKVSRLSLELNADVIARAVHNFIRARVESLGFSLDLSVKIEEKLIASAQETFLWVALAVESLRKCRDSDALKMVATLPQGLQGLYEHMAVRVSRYGQPEQSWKLLSAVVCAYRPLSLEELSAILSEPEPQKLVPYCASFLNLKEDVVRLVHLSAREFLRQRLGSSIGQTHQVLFRKSLTLMRHLLVQDPYQLEALDTPAPQEFNIPKPDPLGKVKYSCIHWADHVMAWSSHQAPAHRGLPTEVMEDIQRFLHTKLFYWIEALCLMRSLPTGLLAISKLLKLLNPLQSTENVADLHMLIVQAREFIRSNVWPVQEWPLQIYASALPFLHPSSKVRELAGDCFKPRWMLRTDFEKWGYGPPISAAEWSLDQEFDRFREALQAIAVGLSHLARIVTPGRVDILDLASLEHRLSVPFDYQGGTVRLTMFDDAMLLAIVQPEDLILFSLEEYRQLWRIPGRRRDLAIAFSSADNLVAATFHSSIRLHDAATGSLHSEYLIEDLDTLTLEDIHFFSDRKIMRVRRARRPPDGVSMAFYEREAVRFEEWDLTSKDRIPMSADTPVPSGLLSPRGRFLVSVVRYFPFFYELRIEDVYTKRKVLRLRKRKADQLPKLAEHVVFASYDENIVLIRAPAPWYRPWWQRHQLNQEDSTPTRLHRGSPELNQHSGTTAPPLQPWSDLLSAKVGHASEAVQQYSMVRHVSWEDHMAIRARNGDREVIARWWVHCDNQAVQYLPLSFSWLLVHRGLFCATLAKDGVQGDEFSRWCRNRNKSEWRSNSPSEEEVRSNLGL